jgi:hypothetical protein
MTVKDELISKIKKHYYTLTGDELSHEFTDDEIIYAMMIWMLDELI